MRWWSWRKEGQFFARSVFLTHDPWLPETYQCFSCGQRFEVIEIKETLSCSRCNSVALEVAHRELCYASEIEIEVLNVPTR